MIKIISVQITSDRHQRAYILGMSPIEEHKNVKHFDLVIDAWRIIEAFSKEVTNKLIYENKPCQINVSSPTTIAVGSTNLSTTSEFDTQTIAYDLNLVLESPGFLDTFNNYGR